MMNEVSSLLDATNIEIFPEDNHEEDFAILPFYLHLQFW